MCASPTHTQAATHTYTPDATLFLKQTRFQVYPSSTFSPPSLYLSQTYPPDSLLFSLLEILALTIVAFDGRCSDKFIRRRMPAAAEPIAASRALITTGKPLLRLERGDSAFVSAGYVADIGTVTTAGGDGDGDGNGNGNGNGKGRRAAAAEMSSERGNGESSV